MLNTTAQLLSDLADTLQKDEGTLQVYWQNILTQSQTWAYGLIVQTFAQKGYTLAQIAAWDNGADWERNLTLWAALRRGAALQNVDDRLVGTLDVRKDLAELQGIITAGAWVDPAGTAGQAGYGDVDTSEDVFVWPDPASQDDFPGPGRGQPTQF